MAAGADDLELCAVYLNQGRFMIVCFLIPTTCILLNIKNILIYLGQDETACHYAQIYINY